MKTTNFAALVFGIGLGAASLATAQPSEPPSTGLFCKDSTGVAQPMKYVGMPSLIGAYDRDFGFSLSRKSSDNMLLFSDPAHTRYHVSYAIQTGKDPSGRRTITLLSMTTDMEGSHKTYTGTEMCLKTMGIVMH